MTGELVQTRKISTGKASTIAHRDIGMVEAGLRADERETLACHLPTLARSGFSTDFNSITVAGAAPDCSPASRFMFRQLTNTHLQAVILSRNARID
jgi:hypothetical protein